MTSSHISSISITLQASAMKLRTTVSLIATSDTGFLTVETTADSGTRITMAHPCVFEKLRVDLKPIDETLQLPWCYWKGTSPNDFSEIIEYGEINLRWCNNTIVEKVICNPIMEYKLVAGTKVILGLGLFENDN